MCTRCCLPLSLSQNHDDGLRKRGSVCQMMDLQMLRLHSILLRYRIIISSHLVSMRMASSASAGFSRISPSTSTTCMIGHAAVLKSAVLRSL